MNTTKDFGLWVSRDVQVRDRAWHRVVACAVCPDGARMTSTRPEFELDKGVSPQAAGCPK